jgi:hypothetical protein
MGGREVNCDIEGIDPFGSKFLLKLPQEYASAGHEYNTPSCFLYLSQDGRLFSFEGIGLQQVPRLVWLFDGPDDASEWLEQRLKWLKATIEATRPEPKDPGRA